MARFQNPLFVYLVFILVSCKACLGQDPPRCASELSVAINPGTTPIQNGSSITLRCNVSSESHGNASWYRDETELVRGSQQVDVEHFGSIIYRPDDIDLGGGCSNFGMLLFGLVPSDTGVYTCRLGNATSDPIDVKVMYVPDDIYPICEVDLFGGNDIGEGESVRMTCQSQTGYPPWSLNWSADVMVGNETVSTDKEYVTSLLEVQATRDLFGTTFTCSAECNSENDVNCSSSETRTCSVDGFLFSALPRQQRVDVGGNATYNCETMVRGYQVTWMVPTNMASVTVDCSPYNTSCNLTVSKAGELLRGEQFSCALISDQDEHVKERTVTLYVGPDLPTTVQMTTTKVPTVSTQQSTTTTFISIKSTSKPTTPFVSTTAVVQTTVQSTTTPATTTTLLTTTKAPVTTQLPTTTPFPGIVSSISPIQTIPMATRDDRPTAPLPTTSSVGASQAPATGGIGAGEIIAIVVTIAILLIILVILFTFLLIRGKRAKAEKRGKLRRDAAMLDSQAPSPFNPYDMQTVIGGNDVEEMKGPAPDDSQDKLIPIIDPEADDAYGDGSFDNPAYDKDSAVHASIPSNPETPPEPIYQNGSIDQGYYEHYPDSEAGGNTVVRGVISSTAL